MNLILVMLYILILFLQYSTLLIYELVLYYGLLERPKFDKHIFIHTIFYNASIGRHVKQS